MTEETKRCLFCAENIQAAARICRFCNREQSQPMQNYQQPYPQQAQGYQQPMPGYAQPYPQQATQPMQGYQQPQYPQQMPMQQPMQGYQQPMPGYAPQPYPQPAPIQVIVQNNNTNTNTNANAGFGGFVRTSDRSKWLAFLLCAAGGAFGIHKFYLGKPIQGLLYFFTFGFFFIGWGVDTLKLLSMSQHEFDVQYNTRLLR
jgi:TM2 domain-containing membrane protein YozV